MFANPDKFMFTTRRGKRREATLNQVLGMPTMWSDESIAHAERMRGKGIYANPEIKKGKGKYRQSNWGQRENWFMGAESMAERNMGGYEEEILGKLPKRRFKQVANPRTFGGQVSQREKARRAQAQQAKAHQAALMRHYISQGLSPEEAMDQHAIDKTMRREHYEGLRTASNPNGAGRVVNARFKGRCAVTGEEYPAGTPIVKTEAGWTMAEHA